MLFVYPRICSEITPETPHFLFPILLFTPSAGLQGDVDHEFTGSAEGLAHRCVEVVYMTTLLRDGYGFPEHSRNVTYALKSDGMEVSYTLPSSPPP